MQYHDVGPIGRKEAATAFASGDAGQIASVLVSIGLHESDWRWA